MIVKTILFFRKGSKIVNNKILTIIFGVEVRVEKINVKTILGKIVIINAHAKNIFIQNSINKLISTSGIGSWNSLLWHNKNSNNFRRSRRSLKGNLM